MAHYSMMIYTLHMTEVRSAPGVQFTCNGTVTKFTFIALPGIGTKNSQLFVLRSGPSNSFRDCISTYKSYICKFV